MAGGERIDGGPRSVVVVGAGIVGLSTAAALVAHGSSVTVYERAVPGSGQSGGESRIFRHSHDDPRLVALACASRELWREWEDRFGVELLSADGAIGLGPAVPDRLAVLGRVGGVRARMIDGPELAERLPLLARWSGPAMLDEDGGVIRTRAAVGALVGALGGALVADEVMSVRPTGHATVEVRAAGAAAEHERVVVCAGRGTPALAAGVGLSLPVRHAAHVRATYPVRGAAPARLACLLDGSGAFGEPSAYADPLPGNGHYAVGLGDIAAREDGSVLDPGDFEKATERTSAYVARALPGLSPEPVATRHCWVTELPWSSDAIAAWQADGLTFLAGNNLFKHAPAVGRALARAARGDGLAPELHPDAKLGARPQT
jgi:sarcosine oxidase